MNTIEEKLDALAEYKTQKDLLTITKRELLDEVRIPDEVLAIMDQANRRIEELNDYENRHLADLDAKQRAELAKIVIPAEVQVILNGIDEQREAIRTLWGKWNWDIQEETKAKRKAISEQMEAKTKAVYDEVAQRKRDIEIEFSGKGADVEANIQALEAEIKADMIRQAAEKLKANPKAKDLSVKGKYFHAVYVKGRITWNTDKMEAWMEDHPFLAAARKEGEPSVTLRKV